MSSTTEGFIVATSDIDTMVDVVVVVTDGMYDMVW
jgi:hypothetical protein